MKSETVGSLVLHWLLKQSSIAPDLLAMWSEQLGSQKFVKKDLQSAGRQANPDLAVSSRPVFDCRMAGVYQTILNGWSDENNEKTAGSFTTGSLPFPVSCTMPSMLSALRYNKA